MLRKRIMSLLGSGCILLSPFNIVTANASTPLKATQVIDSKDNNIEIHNNFESFMIQYEKDKTENERLKLEKQKQEELKRMEEQKQNQRDLVCYYNPNDITEPSGISVQKAYDLLKGTTFQNYDVAQAFVDAEKLKPAINTVFLISLCRLESGHGQNSLSQINNISSWRASRGWKNFNSKTDCIYQTAELISTKYLNPNGCYYKGSSDVYTIGKTYCEGNDWAKQLNAVANYIRR
jgi:beta-N-acetylglucosaminidase